MSENTTQIMPAAMPTTARSDAPQLTVVLASTNDDLERAMPRWLDLLERGTVGHNVHNDPRMILFTLQEQPSLQPNILLVSQGDRLVCVAPFYIQPARFSFEFSVWQLLSLRARALRVFGESVVLATDIDPELCVTIVADFLRTMAPSIDYLQVYGMNYSEPFWQAVLRSGSFAARSGWACFAMRMEKTHKVLFKESFEAYVASLNPGTRKTLRWTRRRLFRDGTARIEKFTEPADVSRLLEWVELIDRESWQGTTFGKIRRTEDAHQRLVEQVAAEGWLRSYVLLINEEPVAFEFGMHYRGVYYGLENAYRQRFSDDSPGSVLRFCLLDELHTNNPATAWDFGFGDLQYKRSMGNVQHDAAIVYFAPGNRWRFILRLQTMLNSIYDGMRTALVRLRIDRLVRKLIKRQK